jgi:hypothetical protein
MHHFDADARVSPPFQEKIYKARYTDHCRWSTLYFQQQPRMDTHDENRIEAEHEISHLALEVFLLS